MKALPAPEVYGEEFIYFPWGRLIDKVISLVDEHSPKSASFLDLMCGPGYLLHRISEIRPDLKLSGLDICKDFLQHAESTCSDIDLILKDVLRFRADSPYSVITCTGGLHHISYEDQYSLLEVIGDSLADDGFVIIADSLIDGYSDEKQRRLAAAKLGHEYLCAAIRSEAPDTVIEAAINILYNDVLCKGEYKTSSGRIKDMLNDFFSDIKIYKTWPDKDVEYGDYIFFLRR